MSKKSLIKLALLRRTVTDSQHWRVCMLGRNGFAWRFIAKRVFNDSSDTGMLCVGRMLLKEGIKVTEYRRGETDEAKGVVAALFKTKGK